jgi:sigma-B regulation protein RsbU (phosphoserine phosphatase)
MIPATTPAPKMRLVRDDPPDLPSDSDDDLNVLRQERDDAMLDAAEARSEAAVLRRRAAQLDDHLSRLEGELRLAGRLQRDFLPKSLPLVGPARFSALFRPAAHVSGDFYNVCRLDEDHVGFYVADAVGHGVPAALLTMFIKHSLVTKQIEPGGGYRLLSPGESLAQLNAALLDQGLSGSTFATAAYGVANVRTRNVTLARAGHPAPLLLRRDGSIGTIDCDGGLLGILPDEVYTEASFTIAPGDRLVLYTDGVEVAFADRVDASLGVWRTLLATHVGRPGDQFLPACAAAVEAFNQDAPPRDDLTLLMLQMD